MKKNILIIILSITTILFFLYSFIKADEANKAMIMADEQRMEAEALWDQAIGLQQRAQEAAAEAKRQEAIAMDIAAQLAECQAK